MPNVNYSGKPSQDPNAPPESGVTSIPLGTTRSGLLTEQEALDMVSTDQHSPWPPLSREQVVKLHEALVAFRGEMEASKGIRSDEDQQNMIWGAAVELDGLLVEMGIGSPPPTRTWTHKEVAKVAEEVQSSAHQVPVAPAWLRLDWWGSGVRLPVRNVSGRDLAEGQMVTTEQVQVEPPKRNCWTCRHMTDTCEVRRDRSNAYQLAAAAWKVQVSPQAAMPPKDSDGCPGWERKP